LSVLGFVLSITAAINGIRFVMTDFTINGISYGMAMPFLFALLTYMIIGFITISTKQKLF
jgi:succinate dehydrogenase/fumarate reductase cytochrome b subunit